MTSVVTVKNDPAMRAKLEPMTKLGTAIAVVMRNVCTGNL
jgi:hypothetical protein